MDSVAGGNRQADNTIKQKNQTHMAWKVSLKQTANKELEFFILGTAQEPTRETRKEFNEKVESSSDWTLSTVFQVSTINFVLQIVVVSSQNPPKPEV